MLFLAAFSGTLLLADQSKISPELLASNAGGTVKVIVQYDRSMGATMLSAIPLLGGSISQTFSILDAAVISLPLSSLEALSNQPEVQYISPDRALRKQLDYSAAAVNAQSAWTAKLTGLGVGVAVIDSGVAQLPDFALAGLSRVVYKQDFTGATVANLLTGSKDPYGHGTHVAGIIAGNGSESACANCTRSLKGIAPQAMIIDLRVLDQSGEGSDSNVITAIEQAIKLKNFFNIRVINLSLGRPVYESYQQDPLCQAVEAAWKAGIVVVVAAGNDGRDNSVGNQGYGTIQSPANDPYVITVGAMKAMGTYPRNDDLIASYSSKGPSAIDFVAKPDILAPGNHVVSLESPNSALAADTATAVPLSYYEATTSNAPSKQFLVLNGTSMATPVVSGAVADILEGEPSLTPDAVKARLMKTAYKAFPTSSTAVDQVTGQTFTSYYDLFTVGAGYLDIAAALADREPVHGNAISPVAHFNPTNGNVYLAFSSDSVWTSKPNAAGSTTTFAPMVVWGSKVLNANGTVSGNRSVWKTSNTDAFNVLWGDGGVFAAESGSSTTVDAERSCWKTDSSSSDSDLYFSVQP